MGISHTARELLMMDGYLDNWETFNLKMDARGGGYADLNVQDRIALFAVFYANTGISK